MSLSMAKEFDETIFNDYLNSLPFKLTADQQKATKEILNDFKSNQTLNRLVLGDVGSGKTVVAVNAIYANYLSGYQSVLMAPTEILAFQHYDSIVNLLKNTDVKIELLTGSTKKKQKDMIYEQIKNNEIDLLIGTHAVLNDLLEFNNLGLVVTDEQHRFGVRQRGVINKKGENPDVLVMTATPIPRTLALILYGDLDISIIDELPPNRKVIDTFAVTKGMEDRINNFVKEQIDEGRQAYIVCPLVEETEEINAKSVRVSRRV